LVIFVEDDAERLADGVLVVYNEKCAFAPRFLRRLHYRRFRFEY